MATAVETAPQPLGAEKAKVELPPVVGNQPNPAPAAGAPAATPPAKDSAPAPAGAPAGEVKQSLLADEPAKPAADAKPAEKPAEAAPAEWKLEAPKDSGATAEQIKAIEDWAKPQGFTQEQAQKLLERDLAAKAAAESAAKQVVVSQFDTWRADSEKKFGAKLPDMQENAKRALRTFDKNGTFREILNKTPYGSHAALIEFLDAIGGGLREDTPVGGNVNAPKPLDPVRAFYGDDHTKPATR